MRAHALSIGLGKESAKRGAKAYVECSSGMVYKPDRSPSKETDKLKPWNRLGKWQMKIEEDLATIKDLNLVILRFAHVYGDYDSKSYFAKGTLVSRIYEEKGKDLMWLYTPELRVHTIHVVDAATAAWTAAVWRSQNSAVPKEYLSPGTSLAVPIFNIVDKGDTRQEVIVEMTRGVFNIKVGFINALISQFAKFNLDSVIDDLNEETLQPWADLCAANGIKPGPLSPYFEKDFLKDNDLSMDGTLFEKCTGFKHETPKMSKDQMLAMIDSWKRLGWWPGDANSTKS